MVKMNDNPIFHDDYFETKKQCYKYIVIVVLVIVLIIILLLVIKKQRYYVNQLEFIDTKNAYIIVDNENLDIIKESKKLYIDDISYDFDIDKIEEKNMIYLVNIHFPIDLLVNTKTCKVYLDNESFMNYIIRIVKGV